ncbi:MAG: nitrous oxide reductase accessory protein NosL [Sulfurimonas sp.]|nr:nitrous oxide reductase accessory protein NosL [Sulfurimonas sp.]
MKAILLMILLMLSLNAYQRSIPSYIIDVPSMKLMNSKNAFFVLGNTKHGIMKKNFGFANKKDAEEYVKERGGCVVDYATYVKMTDEDIEEYVKEHGVEREVIKVPVKDTNVTVDKNDTNSDIYNKENMKKYKF